MVYVKQRVRWFWPCNYVAQGWHWCSSKGLSCTASDMYGSQLLVTDHSHVGVVINSLPKSGSLKALHTDMLSFLFYKYSTFGWRRMAGLEFPNF